MREREVSQSSVDADIIEYLLFDVPALTCIKIKAGHATPVPVEEPSTASKADIRRHRFDVRNAPRADMPPRKIAFGPDGVVTLDGVIFSARGNPAARPAWV
jgi:hypothetical protein